MNLRIDRLRKSRDDSYLTRRFHAARVNSSPAGRMPARKEWADSGLMQRGNLVLFDHLISAGEQYRRYIEAERPCGSQVDRKDEFRRLVERDICRLCALENLVD